MVYFADDDPKQIESFSKGAAVGCLRPVDTVVEVRLCDLLAYLLAPKSGSGLWTSPRFRIDDPLEDRDRAIAKWIAVLKGRCSSNTETPASW